MLCKGDRYYGKIVDVMERWQVLWLGDRVLWKRNRCYAKVIDIMAR